MFINHEGKAEKEGVQGKGEMGPDKALKEGERESRGDWVKKEEWWKSAKNARQTNLSAHDRILDGPLKSAYFSVRGCVNTASFLPMAAWMSSRNLL